jgi:hypothetical protein
MPHDNSVGYPKTRTEACYLDAPVRTQIIKLGSMALRCFRLNMMNQPDLQRIYSNVIDVCH